MRFKDRAIAHAESMSGYQTRRSLEALFERAREVPDGGTICEVGVLYGKSAAIFIQIAEVWPIKLIFVDPWLLQADDAKPSFYKLLSDSGVTAHVLEMTSKEAAEIVSDHIDLIHIDANHHPPGPAQDCALWLPKLVSGGVAAFHDYDEPSYPAVRRAVDEACAGWEDLGVIDTLAMRRKP